MVTLIKEKKNKMEITSVTYSKTKETYPDDIFDEEIYSYKKNVVNAANSVYDKVLCDNPSESDFAEKLSSDIQTRIFCKLPQNFYINTPIGRYRPDWAIVYQRKRISGYIEPSLFLVRETKFGYSEFKGTLKSIPEDEQSKIDCALKHFNALNNELDYREVDSYQNFCETLPKQKLE
jgi:type III restriction enzyme